MTQQLLFIDFHPLKEGMSCRRAKPCPVTFQERDVRQVWTLFHYTNSDQPPPLPFTPIHRVNAFAEDLIHDWNIYAGNFVYASRITDEPVWVLVNLK